MIRPDRSTPRPTLLARNWPLEGPTPRPPRLAGRLVLDRSSHPPRVRLLVFCTAGCRNHHEFDVPPEKVDESLEIEVEAPCRLGPLAGGRVILGLDRNQQARNCQVVADFRRLQKAHPVKSKP